MALTWVLEGDEAASRITCFGGDSRPYFPALSSLVNPLVIAPVDQYGALGFADAGQNPNPIAGITPPWFTCPFIDWQDGPETEGVPEPVIYTFRWQLFYNRTNGTVRYRRNGEPFTLAPADLFPVPLLPSNLFTDFTLCFDQVALPVFAWADLGTGEVNLRHRVAGVPTFRTWTGYSPKLWYDGQAQRDTTLRDVVCYYLRAGLLYARFQRDNFGVEYLVADVSATYGLLTRLTKVDRNAPAGAPLPAGNPIFGLLFALGTPASVEIMLQSNPYPVFPLPESDAGGYQAAVPLAGAYAQVIVPGGSYADLGGYIADTPIAGAYQAVVVSQSETEPGGGYSASVALTGAYTLTVIAGGTYVEAGGGYSASVALTGAYTLTVIAGGTYADQGGYAALTPLSGVYAP